MSDRWANTSAFDEAKRLVGRLAAQAARQSTPQTFTLLRYSRAAQGSGSRFDMLEERVDTSSNNCSRRGSRCMQPSQEAIGAGPALTAVEQLLPELAGEDVVVHLVSDFRMSRLARSGATAESLKRISQAAEKLYLINCMDAARPNLAIAALAPLPGMRGAGVPVSLEVTVQNFGSARPRTWRSCSPRTVANVRR